MADGEQPGHWLSQLCSRLWGGGEEKEEEERKKKRNRLV